MKLAIVGSQALDRRQGEHVWVLVEGLILAWKPVVIVSGGATGVDSVAETCAKSNGYWEELNTLVVCRPEVHSWDPVGKRGFKARNMEIVNQVDRVVRISKHLNQNTYGSGWTADYAEEQLGPENVFRWYV